MMGAKSSARLSAAGASPVARIVTETEAKATANRARASANVESIQRAGKDILVSIQSILRHGNRFGYWETPRQWAPAQTGQATLNVDLRGRIKRFLPTALREMCETQSFEDERKRTPEKARLALLIDEAVLVITRYLVLLRIGPVGFNKRGNSSLDPNTIRDVAYSWLPQLFAESIWVTFSRNPGLIDDVPRGLLRHVSVEFFDSLSGKGRKTLMVELQRMFMLASKGLWNYVPIVEQKVRQTTPVAGDAKPAATEPKFDPHQPLPDDYVGTMGSRSLWLIETLGPALIPVLRSIKKIYVKEDKPERTPRTVETRRRAKLQEFLLSHVWSDANGVPITELPFPIYSSNFGGMYSKGGGRTLVEGGAESHRLAWPPTDVSQVFALTHAVQLAHMFVVGMTLVGRKGEIVSLRRDCVRYARNGKTYASGKTYKLVEQHDGKWRDWVLPELAAVAIEQQARLIAISESIGHLEPDRDDENARLNSEPSMHLWGQSGHSQSDRAAPLIGINHALAQYAKTLCMDPKPGGQAFRPHRLRKTVGRLVALAIAQAPKILMRVFGHKAIEMTMTYILTDKSLRAEIEKVCRELKVMRATQVVLEMVAAEDSEAPSLPNGGFGGPAAASLQQAIVVHKDGLHRVGAEWGAETARDLAEILTLQGKAWHYVRPGIICTKFPGTESGPCNKSRGHPEPARCQSHCKHRLEESFLRGDVDAALGDSVRAYNDALRSGDELMRDSWAGQIRIHLGRFEDIRAKWSSDPTVQLILSEMKQGGALA